MGNNRRHILHGCRDILSTTRGGLLMKKIDRKTEEAARSVMPDRFVHDDRPNVCRVTYVSSDKGDSQERPGIIKRLFRWISI